MFLIDRDNFNNTPMMLGIGYSERAIITSSNGFHRFLESGGKVADIIEGKYLVKYPLSENTTIIETDDTGAELLFLYRNEDYWCLCTSLYQLAVYIKSKNMPLTVKKADLALNFLQTSLFEQPITNNPNFEEILLIPECSCICVKDGYIEVQKKKRHKEWRDKYNILPFYKKSSYFISFFRALVVEISKNYDVNLELSGGIDSRVLFAMLKDEVVSGEIKISTDKNRKNDYLIVKMLSDLYNFSLSPYKDNNIGKRDFCNKYQLFKYGNVGISRTHKRPNSGSGTCISSTFRINGGGGGRGKSFYNENYMAYVNLIEKSYLNDKVKSKVINEFISLLGDEGYQNHPSLTMINLYSKYRMRYFAGRSWYYSLLGLILSPFNSIMFQSIFLSKDIEEFFKKDLEYICQHNLIQLYLLYTLAPELAFMITDSTDKNFNIEDINLIEKIIKDHESIENNNFAFLLYNDADEWEENLSGHISSEEKSYDDLIYEDINKGIKLLENSQILQEDYLLGLRKKIENKTLSKIEEGSLLHVTSLLLLAN